MSVRPVVSEATSCCGDSRDRARSSPACGPHTDSQGGALSAQTQENVRPRAGQSKTSEPRAGTLGLGWGPRVLPPGSRNTNWRVCPHFSGRQPGGGTLSPASPCDLAAWEGTVETPRGRPAPRPGVRGC